MNYGVFLRANYRDGLTLGHVTDGLVGGVLISDVPDLYNEKDMETLLLCYGAGFRFGGNLHENVVLKEESFPPNTRFNKKIDFETCVTGAVKELTKQRLSRQAA